MGKPAGRGWWLAFVLPIIHVVVYGVGVLDVFLVGCMLLEWQIDKTWLVALFLPVALCAWTGMSLRARDAAEPPEGNEIISAKPAQHAARKPVETPGKILSHSAVWIANSVMILTVTMAGFLGGMIFFGLLRRVLFEGATITPDIFSAMTQTPAWVEALIPIIVAPMVIAVVYGVIAMARAMTLAAQTRNPDRFNRVLLPHEESFLDRATEGLVDYAEAQKYPRIWAFAPIVVGSGGIALAMALCFSLSSATVFAVRYLALSNFARPELLQSFGVSSLLAIFAGCIVAWPLMQKLSERHARFAEHLYVRHGWNTMSSNPRSAGQYFVELETDLRLDKLDAEESFDPAVYLQQAFRRRSALSVKAGGLALSVCLVFAVLDGFAYQAFGDEAALQSGYFEFNQHTYRYDDASAIETACYVGTNDGQPALRLRYKLIMPDGQPLNLSDFLTNASLERLERIDSQASSNGAERRAGERRGLGQAGRPALDPECLPRLRQRFGDKVDRARQLLGI